jgi:hypothetical protein
MRVAKKRANTVLPAAGIASLVVAAVTVGAYLVSPHGSGASSLAQAINSLPKTDSIALLEQQRQEIIVMNAAVGTLSTASKPAVVLPAQVMSGSSSSSTSSTITQTVAAPDPAQAQQIAQELMSSYGFSVSGQWSCLDDLWTRESSWMYDAVNAQSGAYGIAQALPPDRMDSIASDWQTNAVTQIKWGLSYISSRYGTPCAAWDHEVSIGWY